MAKFTNHKQDFERIDILNNLNKLLFWALLAINVVPLLMQSCQNSSSIYTQNERLINFFNIFFFILSFVITIVTEFVLIPVAEKKRRLDYFENSFAKQFQLQSSEEYFTNDEIEPGFYKMAVNLFQNILFTSTVSKKMVPGIIIKGLIAFIIFLVLAFIGFSADKTFIPILQAIFSLNILGHTIKFLIYNQRVIGVFDELKNLFGDDDFKTHVDKNIPKILKIYVDYECIIAWGAISLKNSLFKKLNDKVESEWKTIKIKFKIQ